MTDARALALGPKAGAWRPASALRRSMRALPGHGIAWRVALASVEEQHSDPARRLFVPTERHRSGD